MKVEHLNNINLFFENTYKLKKIRLLEKRLDILNLLKANLISLVEKEIKTSEIIEEIKNV